ncbi:MAG: response regulator [Anaerolineae bacterium]|nr:response regulator [Anaerolineae bacterium]MCA9908322.1 response regulator [Anaerolineae bacterium]
MKKLLILHLEDDLALKDTVFDLLSVLDPESEVIQFTNSDETLQYIEKSGAEVDLFLLDVRVPGQMDGIGVAKRIRSLAIGSRIVFMSAYQRPSTSELSDSLDFQWIKKPWSIDQFSRLLQQAHTHTDA